MIELQCIKIHDCVVLIKIIDFTYLILQERENNVIRGFPETMKDKRKELHISISGLSKLTDISKSALYDYENGTREPSTMRFLTICSVLKINPNKFIK